MLGCSLWGHAPPTSSGRRQGARELELLILLLIPLGWVSAQSQPAPCAPLCECSEAARIVKCVNHNLTEVPAELPPYVRSLFLMGNLIRNLSSASFLSRSLLELSSLNLSGNQLSWVGAETFAGLPSLKQLDLSDNSLTWLSPMALGNVSSPLEELDLSRSLYNNSVVVIIAEMFKMGTLPNLKRLDLSSNNLVNLPASMFSTLSSLEHLDVHNNSLENLYNVIFGRLQKLRSFSLSDNALKSLRNDTLQQLQDLPLLTLNLSHNPWVCDCHIKDLVNWLKNNNQVEGKTALKCSSPQEMQEHSLESLSSSELDCLPSVNDKTQLQTSYVFLGIVLALIGAVFLLVLYLNRKGIKRWMYNIRDACRDHMEGYHYRYEINADPRLTNLSSNSDV